MTQISVCPECLAWEKLKSKQALDNKKLRDHVEELEVALKAIQQLSDSFYERLDEIERITIEALMEVEE